MKFRVPRQQGIYLKRSREMFCAPRRSEVLAPLLSGLSFGGIVSTSQSRTKNDRRSASAVFATPSPSGVWTTVSNSASMEIHRSGDPFGLDEFLERPLFAHLATGSADGPRESPVWFLRKRGAIWLIGSSNDSFPKRIVTEPRCAVGLVDFDLARGFLQHVGMRGEAHVCPRTTISYTDCYVATLVTNRRDGTGGSAKP